MYMCVCAAHTHVHTLAHTHKRAHATKRSGAAKRTSYPFCPSLPPSSAFFFLMHTLLDVRGLRGEANTSKFSNSSSLFRSVSCVCANVRGCVRSCVRACMCVYVVVYIWTERERERLTRTCTHATHRTLRSATSSVWSIILCLQWAHACSYIHTRTRAQVQVLNGNHSCSPMTLMWRTRTNEKLLDDKTYLFVPSRIVPDLALTVQLLVNMVRLVIKVLLNIINVHPIVAEIFVIDFCEVYNIQIVLIDVTFVTS